MGEWGYHFHNGLANTYHGYDPNNIPTTKEAAYNYVKAYFQERVAAYGGRALHDGRPFQLRGL